MSFFSITHYSIELDMKSVGKISIFCPLNLLARMTYGADIWCLSLHI